MIMLGGGGFFSDLVEGRVPGVFHPSPPVQQKFYKIFMK